MDARGPLFGLLLFLAASAALGCRSLPYSESVVEMEGHKG